MSLKLLQFHSASLLLTAQPQSAGITAIIKTTKIPAMLAEDPCKFVLVCRTKLRLDGEVLNVDR
jgi:hypothetical protein